MTVLKSKGLFKKTEKKEEEKAPRKEAKSKEKFGVVFDLSILNSDYASGLYGEQNRRAIRKLLSENEDAKILAADTRWHREEVELLMYLVGEGNLYVTGPYTEFDAKTLERLFGAYTPYQSYNKIFADASEEKIREQMQKDGITSYVWVTTDSGKTGPNYYTLRRGESLTPRNVPSVKAVMEKSD